MTRKELDILCNEKLQESLKTSFTRAIDTVGKTPQEEKENGFDFGEFQFALVESSVNAVISTLIEIGIISVSDE